MINTLIKVITITLILLTTSCYNQETKLTLKNNRYCYDGDTCYVKHKGKQERLRIQDIDCPEMNTPEGFRSMNYTNKLIRNAISIKINVIGRDKYNRLLGDIIIDGKRLSEILIAEEMARRWYK